MLASSLSTGEICARANVNLSSQRRCCSPDFPVVVSASSASCCSSSRFSLRLASPFVQDSPVSTSGCSSSSANGGNGTKLSSGKNLRRSRHRGGQGLLVAQCAKAKAKAEKTKGVEKVEAPAATTSSVVATPSPAADGTPAVVAAAAPAADGAPAVSAAPSTTTEVDEAKIARRAAEWKRMEKLRDSGTVHRGRVDACNSGGLLVRVGSLQGFLPFSQLNGTRIPKDGSKSISDVGKELVGQQVSVKVIEVMESERRLIVSEKQAVLLKNIQKIKEGSIYKGIVNCVTDYGAFVDLQFPDGSYPISGLVHVTELSWDPVPFPKDFITQGQEVDVKVVQVDREKAKLALSIKQLQVDPLLETLDTLMPAREGEPNSEVTSSDAELLGTSLPGLEQICEYMLQEEGISGVAMGRQASEKRVVSQDLELWLSNESVEDGKFTLLARAGRQVQEVHLITSLDREGIKAAVQRVTTQVP